MNAPPTTAPPVIMPRTIAKAVAEELVVVVTAMGQRTKAAQRVRARIDWMPMVQGMSPEQRRGLADRIQGLAEYINALKA